MKILLTGGTGYIGGTVLRHLIAGGHDVTAVARSDDSAAALSESGATGLVGDLYDSAWLATELASHDGAIHTASPGDETSAAMDQAVVDATISAFGGTPKPFLLTGGIWSYGDNALITEASALNPPPISAWRAASQAQLLASDVNATIVDPGVVYGNGGGLPNLLTQGPRDENGALILLGSGEQHWTSVHVDDLADMYVHLLEYSDSADRYVVANGDNPTVRQLGETIGPVQGEPAAATRARLGEYFADALLLDQQATGAAARETGWAPSRPSLVDLMTRGYYSEGT